MFNILSSLNGLTHLVPQQAPRTGNASSESTGPVDRFSPQEPTAQEQLFYKPNHALLARPATANNEANSGGLNMERFLGKLGSAVSDITGKLRNIPELRGLAGALQTATNTIPGLIEAIQQGDWTKVTRQVAELAQTVCAAVVDLGKSGAVKFGADMLKALQKATPALGMVVGGVDVAVDVLRGYQAPNASQEESLFHTKRSLDVAITGISAVDCLTGPLAPAAVSVAVALSVASMIVGARANELREQRQRGR